MVSPSFRSRWWERRGGETRLKFLFTLFPHLFKSDWKTRKPFLSLITRTYIGLGILARDRNRSEVSRKT